MTDMQTPLKKLNQPSMSQQKTTAYKLASSNKATKHETQRERQFSHTRPKQSRRRKPSKNLCKPSGREAELNFKLKYYYECSIRRQKQLEMYRTFNLPKNVGHRKRERARSYDQLRRERTPVVKGKKVKPLKHDHPWGNPGVAQKKITVDQVCKKHKQPKSMSYEDLSAKIKSYGKRALSKIQKQKRDLKRSQRRIERKLMELEINQALRIGASRKRELKRSKSELARAFTWRDGQPV